MSVVFINHPLETFTPTVSGALATIIWELCREARVEGRSPTVVTRNSVERQFPWENTVTLEYPAIPQSSMAQKALRAHRKLTGWNHLRHRAYAVRVAGAVKALSEDAPLILINDPEMTIYLRSRYPKRRIVHWFENQQEARPRVQRDYAAACDVTCGVSRFTSNWVKNYYGVREAPTLYNGVDSAAFCPAPNAVDGCPVVNFVGRTGIEKAPDLILDAALGLCDRNIREFRIQLVGSNHWDRFELDEYQQSLTERVSRLEAEGIEVRRPGHIARAELPMEFRKAHIHVVPSRWDEPFGLTTVEGMATGLATVGSNTGGTPEVIGDSDMLFERNNVSSLTDCLQTLVTSQSLRAEKGKCARARAMEFSWSRTWKELKVHAAI